MRSLCSSSSQSGRGRRTAACIQWSSSRRSSSLAELFLGGLGSDHSDRSGRSSGFCQVSHPGRPGRGRTGCGWSPALSSGGALAPALARAPAGTCEISLTRGIVFSHEAARGREEKLTPVLTRELRRGRRGKGGAGRPSWFVDETYLKARAAAATVIGPSSGTVPESTPCLASAGTWPRPRRSSARPSPSPACFPIGSARTGMAPIRRQSVHGRQASCTSEQDPPEQAPRVSGDRINRSFRVFGAVAVVWGGRDEHIRRPSSSFVAAGFPCPSRCYRSSRSASSQTG